MSLLIFYSEMQPIFFFHEKKAVYENALTGLPPFIALMRAEYLVQRGKPRIMRAMKGPDEVR